MSGLVLINSEVQFAEKIVKTVTVLRSTSINMGVRIWYQVLTDELEMFQRWSMLMDPTDEVLMCTQPGDILDIEFIQNVAEDLVNLTFEPFERNVISSAKFNEAFQQTMKPKAPTKAKAAKTPKV
jgi:hypothetical protein